MQSAPLITLERKVIGQSIFVLKEFLNCLAHPHTAGLICIQLKPFLHVFPLPYHILSEIVPSLVFSSICKLSSGSIEDCTETGACSWVVKNVQYITAQYMNCHHQLHHRHCTFYNSRHLCATNSIKGYHYL